MRAKYNLSHFAQLCGFSACWAIVCSLNAGTVLQDLSHFGHLCLFHQCGLLCVALIKVRFVTFWAAVWFLTLWILLCCSSLGKVRNDSSHSGQLCSFSSVWILMGSFKLVKVVKDFSHIVQLCGFSAVWIIMLKFRQTAKRFVTFSADVWFVSSVDHHRLLFATSMVHHVYF